MSTHTIDELRAHLFDTLSALRDKEKPMELERAQAVADVAKVIVESAKVEVTFLKVTGGTKSTGFLPDDAPPGITRRAIAPAAEAIGDARDRAVLTFLREGAATVDSIIASVATRGKGGVLTDRDAVIVALGRLAERKQITRVGDTYVLADATADARRPA